MKCVCVKLFTSLKNFIQLYKLAMACSKQKHLDAYFNTSAAEWRTNEEPEAKKYRPFNRKYDPDTLSLVSYPMIVALQSLSANLPIGSQ